MTTFVTAGTGDVAMVKVAVFEPAGMKTSPGTTAASELLERKTVWPPGPAAKVRVTVPTEEVPPVTVAGESGGSNAFDAGQSG